MGDGVMFLWDTAFTKEVTNTNIVAMLHGMCLIYRTKFFPEIRKKIVDPPAALRCGIARGRVYSVGNGNDFVGPCINIAARLQKLSLLSFCFARRGFNPEKYMNKSTLEQLVLKSVSIRGIGQSELVFVPKDEFEQLPKEEKRQFRDP